MKLDFIISYDIIDEKRLKKISKYLEKEAFRVQLSVYYIRCNKLKLTHIVNNLLDLMDEEDDIRIFKINLKKSLFLNSQEDIKNFII